MFIVQIFWSHCLHESLTATNIKRYGESDKLLLVMPLESASVKAEDKIENEKILEV